MILLLLWMMTGGQMTDQEIVDFKLGLAKAWLENGHEQMAKDIIRTIIQGSKNKGE